MNRKIMHMTALFMLIALVCGCTLLRKDLKDPEIALLDFRVAGGTPLAPRFALQLRITNPNDLQLKIKSLAFTYSIDDMELLDGVSNDIPVIPAYGETEFTVKGSASLLHALPLIEELSHNPLRSFHYQLKTHVEMTEGWPSSFNIQKNGDIGLTTDKKK